MKRTIAQQKSDAAFSTLLAYKTYSGAEGEDVETNTRSLLVDLMHLSGDYSFTLEEVLLEAKEVYSKEAADITVIWELDENEEATGTTYRFCSQKCSLGFDMNMLNPHLQLPKWAWGKEPKSCSPDGELCTVCEKPIDNTKDYNLEGELAMLKKNLTPFQRGVFKFFDVSTCHITKRDDELIKQSDFPVSVYEYDQGYFIYAEGTNREAEEELRAYGVSEAFINVWKKAIELECYYLRLDADGLDYEEFESFEW